MTNRLKHFKHGGLDRRRHFMASIDSLIIHRGLFLILVLVLWSPSQALSVNEGNSEYMVKLAFLYNFTKFVEWPSTSYQNPGAPLAICIVGDDPFNQDLEMELRTRTVGAHPVDLKRSKTSDILTACHIVFIPVTEKNQAARIVSGLKGSSTLTVGEVEGFALQGGIINFMIEDNKLHFEVNTLAAERAGLKISSKLLSLAKIVREPAR